MYEHFITYMQHNQEALIAVLWCLLFFLSTILSGMCMTLVAYEKRELRKNFATRLASHVQFYIDAKLDYHKLKDDTRNEKDEQKQILVEIATENAVLRRKNYILETKLHEITEILVEMKQAINAARELK